MLTGHADIDALAADAPTVETYFDAPIEFDAVTCFQMTAEMHNVAREAILPPSLHPTVPPALSFQLWRVTRSPFGAFALALTRASCRSGVRARGFTTAAYASTERACAHLRSAFGLPARLARIDCRFGYYGCEIEVRRDDALIARFGGIDPVPMANDDVQYTETLNLAHTPNGLRLIQLEAHHQAERVERLVPRLTAFDPQAWGHRLLDPYHPVSASVATERVTFPPIRFVCKPDELAFSGTEAVRR